MMNFFDDLWDRALASVAIAILRHIFGECPPPFDEDCIACQSAKVIEALKRVRSL